MPFLFDQYMIFVKSRNWHFEWVKRSRLYRLNDLLRKYAVETNPIKQINLGVNIHKALGSLSDGARRKYSEAIEYVEGNIPSSGGKSGMRHHVLNLAKTVAPTTVLVSSGSKMRGQRSYSDGSSFLWVTCPLRNDTARAVSTTMGQNGRIVNQCALGQTVDANCTEEPGTVERSVIEEEFTNITKCISAGRKELIDGRSITKNTLPNRRNRTQTKVVRNIERYWGVPGNITMEEHLKKIIKKFDTLLYTMRPGRGTQSQTLNVIYAGRAACASGCYGFAIPTIFDNPPCFWIGPAFVGGKATMSGGRLNKKKASSQLFDARVMTAVHELTHAVLKTQDVVSWACQPSHIVSYQGSNVALSTVPDVEPYKVDWSTNTDQTFSPQDCQALAEHKPLWTNENAHTFACYVAYVKGEDGFDLS